MDPRIPPQLLTLLAVTLKFSALRDTDGPPPPLVLTDLETFLVDTIVSTCQYPPATFEDLSMLLHDTARHHMTSLWSLGVDMPLLAASFAAYLAATEQELTHALGYPAP